MKRFLAASFVFVVLAASVSLWSTTTVHAKQAGSLSPSDETAAGRFCQCPLIVAEVICSNGKIYINQCFANCDHARDCVPYNA
jgi:hypothetical protein